MELHDLHPDPLEQFRLWLADAEKSGKFDFPNVMALATANSAGAPSVRMVLLKEVTQEGFTFVTNYESSKARELSENPQAALCFFWEPFGRQVRVEGRMEKLPAHESDAYFQSRPRGSQLGAWSSPQSREIPSREVLDSAVREAEKKFQGKEIPRPDNWGGYLLRAERIEFWKLGANRLHDRFLFSKNAGWTACRLAP